jgi:tRNA threonylcarbamoyladenosine biosynthesis protein TsaB
LAGSIALVRDGLIVGTTALSREQARHAQALIPESQLLLRRYRVEPRDLECVAVSVGPGSFTGLRVGVVFAKTLAYAVGCQVVAVETFQAIAAACPPECHDVFVVSDAQRGDLFVGHYHREHSDGVPMRAGEISIENPLLLGERLVAAQSISNSIALAGPAADRLRATLPESIRMPDSEFAAPLATSVALLGERLASVGQVANLWTLEPLYIRRSAAEEKAAMRVTD